MARSSATMDFPPDEQRNHHVRVHHHVPQGQHWHAARARRGFLDIDHGFIAHLSWPYGCGTFGNHQPEEHAAACGEFQARA